MIEFRSLPDDHPDLAHSPLLRAALLTLRYVQTHGAIGLTKKRHQNRTVSWRMLIPFVADVDTFFLQHVFNVAERQREPNVHHHRQTDDLGTGFEVAKGGSVVSCD